MVANFQKNIQSNFKKHFLLHLAGFFIIFMLVVLVIANARMYKKKQELFLQVSNLEKKVKDIQNKNGILQQGINNANDSQYIEKVAREELGLQKQGETAVSFIMPQSEFQKVDISQKNSWWAWLGNTWNFVKSKF